MVQPLGLEHNACIWIFMLICGFCVYNFLVDCMFQVAVSIMFQKKSMFMFRPCFKSWDKFLCQGHVLVSSVCLCVEFIF
jgi:hypothetical protein